MCVAHEKRIGALDRLRSLVILLVVLHHSIIPYAKNGVSWWYVQDSGGVVWFDIALLLNDTFMMPTIFFVVGYFLPSSLLRSATMFFAAKAKRLILPLVFGVFFLGPIIAYIKALDHGGVTESYLSFWFFRYLSQGIEHFHFWFLGVLFVFVSLAWLFRTWLLSQSKFWQSIIQHFRTMKLSLLYFYAALLGMLVLLISSQVQFELWVNLSGILVFQPSRLPIYGGFFIMGLVAANAGWQLQEFSLPRLRLLLPFALVFCVALIASKAGFSQLPRGLTLALSSFFYPLVAMSLFLVALHGALAVVRLKPRLGVSRASYGIYLLHLPLVVVLQYILVGLTYSPWLKAALVTVVAGVASYLLIHLIIRLPVVRTII